MLGAEAPDLDASIETCSVAGELERYSRGMTRSINALWLVMIACSGTGTRGTSSSGAMADPVDRRGEQLPPGHRLYLQGEPHRGGDLDYTCSALESA